MASQKYLFKINNKLKLITLSSIQELTYQEAVVIGIDSVKEQKKQLLLDAQEGDRYFYKRKVVDALEEGLTMLEFHFPSIKDQILKLTNYYNQIN